jgi:hypothetical protein
VVNRWISLVGWAALALVLRAAPAPTPKPMDEGTRRMAARINDIYDRAHPASMAFLSDRFAALIEQSLGLATNAQQRLRMQFALGIQLLQAGRTEDALKTYQGIEDAVARMGGTLEGEGRVNLRMRKALANLRLGEQENCLVNHHAESCLFPLGAAAQHRLPRGSRAALPLLLEQLREFPQDLGSQWLLNLAYMTLGEHPQKVPPQWLIPLDVFASEYPLPKFPDVAGRLGVDVDDIAGGVVLDDFDNDGRLDLAASSWGDKGQLRLFRNTGAGFQEYTDSSGLAGLYGGLNLQQTDYDNDGRLDLWVLRGAWLGTAGRLPNSLLRNNGDGTFTDVTEAAKLLSFHPTQASVWFDYDGDGWLDVFIGNESTDPNDPDPCELYRNNRDGTFTECAAATGLRVAHFVKGVTAADYDNDGRPDLYLSCRQEANLLFHNDGPAPGGGWKFSEVGRRAGVTEPIRSFPTWFFDYDNDGWEDLFVSGYFINHVGDVIADYLGRPNQGTPPKLYRNNRDGTFVDMTAAARLNRVCHTMGSNYGDLDNDGWLDFYLATGDPDFMTLIPNRMFRNNGGKNFQDVTTATGTGHLQKGHGVAFADLDHDGDQDVYAVIGGAYAGDNYRNCLFLNPGTTNRWLKLRLTGKQANRPAIGARIAVRFETPAGPRTVYRTVSGGGSFGGNPLRQEFGLADATAISQVEITWPGSGSKQVLEGLQLDRAYQIEEGAAAAGAWNLPPVKFEFREGHRHVHAALARP